MKTAAAKNKIVPSKSSLKSGFEMPPSLRENLTSAIHGAFEVAVEMAVLEVTKLISVAAEDICGEMRQENESLKEELEKAQIFIDSLCGKMNNEAKRCPVMQDDTESNRTDSQNREGTCSANQPLSNEHQKEQEDEESDIRQENAISGSQKQNNLANDCVEDMQTKKPVKIYGTEATKELSLYCDVKEERTAHRQCMSEDTQDHSPTADSFCDNSAALLVKVKLEKPEKTVASSFLVESLKEEEISQLQSEILEEWTPGGCHFEREEQNVTLSALSQTSGHPSNMDFHQDPALEASSVHLSDFPVYVTEHPPSREHRPSQSYGGPVRRNQGNVKSSLPTCRLCGQTFPLASLLRRHYGQCQQRLSQRVYVPAVGGKRKKIQLYPPGCSPFRCPECSREFNRMENLKTHLRIHTGERPYTCSVCSTSFRHSGALTRHFRIHTGEKPYVCGICGKSFRNCGGLKFHQRSHNPQLQS
ncbi:hypothetical protein WMY93_006588 [Mugilogobius chulae]|uniref:C2H2-type domain-containing protein n=1 Tax=Mugilogobius chulae TaxID=88201 RepID=A0AAW0PRM8_9GOBI